MRRSRGVFLPPIPTNRPRRGDLHRALRGALLDGVLTRGMRLPSSRQAAADYGVSRGLIEEVFTQLADEGFLERRVGCGTFVAQTVPRVPLRAGTGPLAAGQPLADAAGSRNRRSDPFSNPLSSALSRRGRSLAANAACREPDTFVPFNAGVADPREFPWSLWQRLLGRAARALGPLALTFADPRGLPRLRAAIAHYLAQFRGIRCDPDQIVVFNSAQQALNSIAALLLNRGDAVWIEDPCYLGARAAFQLASAALTPVPVDAEGIGVEMTRRRGERARLVYVTPSNQYPTGVALGFERRVALVEWAARRGGWILEDDYDGEFRYEGAPLTPLYSLDSHGRTIYVGTLNKSMFVSLRLAFALVAHALVEPLANLRTQLDGFTPPIEQLAMSLFMDEGHFSSHLRRMRGVYRAKRSALLDALAPMASLGWEWPLNPAGMHLLLSHRDGGHVRTVAEQSGLDIALLSAYRQVRRRGDGLFLRFGALDHQAIADGAATLTRLATLTRADARATGRTGPGEPPIARQARRL